MNTNEELNFRVEKIRNDLIRARSVYIPQINEYEPKKIKHSEPYKNYERLTFWISLLWNLKREIIDPSEENEIIVMSNFMEYFVILRTKKHNRVVRMEYLALCNSINRANEIENFYRGIYKC